jgi:hypothetical protein
MTRILGIDPGISGAVGLFLPDSPVNTVPDGLVDLPVMGEGTKRELNYAALRDIIWTLNPDIVVLERAMAMPSIPDKNGVRRDMGSASTFKFGGGYYAIKAVVACLDKPLHPPVMPGTWKKHFNLPGGDAAKEAARQLAIQRYPQVAPFLTRKMDHQRAEAFLIAVWYAETGGRPARAEPRAKRSAAVPMFDGIDEDDLDIPE